MVKSQGTKYWVIAEGYCKEPPKIGKSLDIILLMLGNYLRFLGRKEMWLYLKIIKYNISTGLIMNWWKARLHKAVVSIQTKESFVFCRNKVAAVGRDINMSDCPILKR